MQIESNQSKLSLGWLPLCIHCEFETNILFLIFLFVEPVPISHHLWAPLIVYLLLNSCCSAFSFFFVLPVCCCRQTVCLSAKGEVSFPVEWIDRFVRRKRWIISAVAKGCREVVWHRHWLSLLRSEGIVGLSWERKRETKREEWAGEREQNCKLDWMRCKCPVGVWAFVQHVAQVGPTISCASLTPDY